MGAMAMVQDGDSFLCESPSCAMTRLCIIIIYKTVSDMTTSRLTYTVLYRNTTMCG